MKKVHADIKPDNIVVGSDYTPKIIDFDLVRDIGSKGSSAGTPYFMAPEVIMEKKFKWSPAQDVYSLGVVLYAMLHQNYMPFEGNTLEDLIAKINAHKFQLKGGITIPTAQLISKCLQFDAASRPSVDDLITEANTIINTPPKDSLIKAATIFNNKVLLAGDLPTLKDQIIDMSKINEDWVKVYGVAEEPKMKEMEEEGEDPELPEELKMEEKIPPKVLKNFNRQELRVFDSQVGLNDPSTKKKADRRRRILVQKPAHPQAISEQTTFGFFIDHETVLLVGRVVGLLALLTLLTALVAGFVLRKKEKTVSLPLTTTDRAFTSQVDQGCHQIKI